MVAQQLQIHVLSVQQDCTKILQLTLHHEYLLVVIGREQAVKNVTTATPLMATAVNLIAPESNQVGYVLVVQLL